MSDDSTRPEDETVFLPKNLLNSVFNDPSSEKTNQNFANALAKDSPEAFEKTLDFYYRPGIFEQFFEGSYIHRMLNREKHPDLSEVPPIEVLKAVKALYEAGELPRRPGESEKYLPRLDREREIVMLYEAGELPIERGKISPEWLNRERVPPMELSKPSIVQNPFPPKCGL